MLILNQDLINSCRVCRSPNQDGDYQCLYQYSSKQEENPVLTEAGVLYENLLDISLNQHHCYPQFLCNSCDLQMKLFKKLKDKAYKTLEYLKSLYDEKIVSEKKLLPASFKYVSFKNEQDTMENEVQEYKENVDVYQENDYKVYQDSNTHVDQFEGNTADEVLCNSEDISFPEQQEITESNNQEYLANVTEIENLSVYSSQRQEDMEQQNLYIESELSNASIEVAIKTESLGNKSFFKIEPSEETVQDALNSKENISHFALKFEQFIDKNDYVTEIYEMLDTYSDDENVVECDALTEEKTETSSTYSDIEFLVEERSDYTQDCANSHEIQSTNTTGKKMLNKDCKINMKSKNRKRDYRCVPCQMEFKSSQEHKLHRIEAHDEKYPCSICYKEFKSLAALHHHMKLHNEQPAYQCEICQKTFNQKGHYQYHMNRHNNIRNFKCEICEKAFLSKADLKVHLRLHTGQRPYVCSICGKDYLMMEHLKTHLLRHTDQYFQCEICKNKFTTHKTLRLHMRTIHEDEPRFKCTFCMKPFRRKHHLEYHLKLHQKNINMNIGYEMVDDPDVVSTEMDYSQDDLDEEYTVDDPGFIALNI